MAGGGARVVAEVPSVLADILVAVLTVDLGGLGVVVALGLSVVFGVGVAGATMVACPWFESVVTESS